MSYALCREGCGRIAQRRGSLCFECATSPAPAPAAP